ncbi:hypothetical protein C9374_007974 [Naegleria lovaniensis]|uniref:Uncharacterized protein n=1 Tax=Naegleria lovaniensis TaxID=51637 RepID=A0AA88GKG0_NAELO|nr:uncharacterized protein C9374_007974 [Naegleria lovaniensis]KAG2378826.1 hypothetical protein C9374_007974 [Naegleria lovaniensis]
MNGSSAAGTSSASTPTTAMNTSNAALKRGSFSMPSPGGDPQQKKLKTESPVNAKPSSSTFTTPASPSSSMTNNQLNIPSNKPSSLTAVNNNPTPPSNQPMTNTMNSALSEKYIQNLLNQNSILMTEIKNNLEKKTIAANIPLIAKFRENTIQILTCMSMMDGIMSQMPAIPVKLSTIVIPKGNVQPMMPQQQSQSSHMNLQQQPSHQQQPNNLPNNPSNPNTSMFQNNLSQSNNPSSFTNQKK